MRVVVANQRKMDSFLAQAHQSPPHKSNNAAHSQSTKVMPIVDIEDGLTVEEHTTPPELKRPSTFAFAAVSKQRKSTYNAGNNGPKLG
jgi:hypothetical protein